MNNRGPDRGVNRQSVPRTAPQEQRTSPVRRGDHGPDPYIDRRPYRPVPPAYQQQPRPARPTTTSLTSTVPAHRAPPPPPVKPQRLPGGVALDSLDDESQTTVQPNFNWRQFFSRITGIKLGPSKAQKYDLELKDRVEVSVGSAFPIAVLNLKGGVGKTAVVEVLGSTFADARRDRVVAVDLDTGDLADRHGRRNSLTMVDLLADRSVTRYADVRAHTYMNGSNLEVLGIPDYAQSKWLIERDDFVRAFSLLRKHYSVVLMDCGTALKSRLTEAILRESRALVIVTSASIDSVRKTRTTLEWLRQNGYQKLVESTVLAINHTERGKPNALLSMELEKLSGQFPPNCVVVLPFDTHVHEGKEISLERLSKKSKREYLELAAALADMFPSRSIAHDRAQANQPAGG